MDNTHNADFGSAIEREIPDTNKIAVQNRTSDKLANQSLANKSLKYSAVFWFVTTLTGQWLFFYYILGFYGVTVINDNMEHWNAVLGQFGVTPYRAGDFSGNLAFAAHAIGAGIVAFGGALQLIPKVRSSFPKFHKINGYVYLTTVFCLAVSGFYLVWIRDPDPLGIPEIGTTINGFLILGFAYLTVRLAIKKDIANHRKWALRLFFVSNAQWILRVGTFSYLVTGNMLGMNPAFGDPFFYMWTFGCYVLPLLTLQLYFYAKERGSNSVKNATSGLLFVITILMIMGMVGYTPFLLNVISGGPIGL
ncbi:DUF2306 domain-containing protein [Thalassotalea sp. ND16A]|uniref:DUF2306 domain-containing protein n=1 Tax=Thalassotalea sp. ND16A TaxID=1535422 RepID=UPI00051A70B6|nr:DUF2306 domain-containing protein [Thalassotalea sp. ND16A]KGJ88787.1 hypothetical protein ND16A_2489 [Thalassotalea sp. ND16A]